MSSKIYQGEIDLATKECIDRRFESFKLEYGFWIKNASNGLYNTEAQLKDIKIRLHHRLATTYLNRCNKEETDYIDFLCSDLLEIINNTIYNKNIPNKVEIVKENKPLNIPKTEISNGLWWYIPLMLVSIIFNGFILFWIFWTIIYICYINSKINDYNPGRGKDDDKS